MMGEPRNWRELLKTNESREGGPWIGAYAELDNQTDKLDAEHNKRAPNHFYRASCLGTKALCATQSQRAVAREMGTSGSVNRWINLDLEEVSRKQSQPSPPLLNTKFRQGSHGREAIRRRLERFSPDAALCKQSKTTQAKVNQGLAAFLSGTPAAECLRIAGLATKEDRVALRVAGEPDDVAKRLIAKVKPDRARLIAQAILAQTGA